MKKNFSRRKIAAIAVAAALTLAGCSNASGGGGGDGQSEADLAAAAAKTKYLAMAGTWTKIDSQGKTNTLVIDSEKASLDFASDGEYKNYYTSDFFASTKNTSSNAGQILIEYKGVSTFNTATSITVSLHPNHLQDYGSAVQAVKAGKGKDFTNGDVCLYKVVNDTTVSSTAKFNPHVVALALRFVSNDKIEALLYKGSLSGASTTFPEVYSITFEKNSGSGSGGQGGGELNFSVYGDWKKQGETRIGWHIQINSNGTFDMYQNDQVTSKYTNRKASINGNRIELSYVMSNNTDMSQKDTFEVSGSASQMKWTLVSSVTTYQGTSNSDTNHSTLLQNMFGLSSSDYPVKEMTFVPY